MMTALLYIVILLFILKLVANVAGACRLAFEVYQKGASSGMSLMIEVEALLLVFAVLFSAMSSGEAVVNRPLFVAGWGVAAIALSQVGMFLVGFFGGWLASRRWRGNFASHPTPDLKADRGEGKGDRPI
jgi:hypothetical protein